MKTRVALLAFLASFALNFVWLVGPLDWRMPLVALGAWYLADLMSGLVHMYMDYLPCTPGNGMAELFFYEGSRASDDYAALRDAVFARVNPLERVLYDFKVHHPRPESLGRRTLIYQVKSTVFFATLPFSLGLNIACLLWRVPNWLVLGAIVAMTAGTLSQYFHGSLHREHNPWIITFLRKLGLLMTPEAHAKHHATLQRDFATINGWSNPVVNILFRFLMRRDLLNASGLEPT